MKFIPFGGFFKAAMTRKAEAEVIAAHNALLEAIWPQFFRDGKLTQEGIETHDRAFEAEYCARPDTEGIESTFWWKGLNKPGMIVRVKALPGGYNYSMYGEDIRTYALGGIFGYHQSEDSTIADDDFVVDYLDIQEMLRGVK